MNFGALGSGLGFVFSRAETGGFEALTRFVSMDMALPMIKAPGVGKPMVEQVGRGMFGRLL